MRCWKCNAEIPDYALFCTHCGCRVRQDARRKKHWYEEDDDYADESDYDYYDDFIDDSDYEDDDFDDDYDDYSMYEDKDVFQRRHRSFQVDQEIRPVLESLDSKKLKDPIFSGVRTAFRGDYAQQPETQETEQRHLQKGQINPDSGADEKKKFILLLLIIVLCIAAVAYIFLNAGNRKQDTQTMQDETEGISESTDMPESTEPAAGEQDVPVMSLIGEPEDIDQQEALPAKSAEATSVIRQEGVDNSAGKLIDGSEKTSWQEGEDGPGTGETVTLTLDSDSMVRYLSFKLGNWHGERYYKGNNRPRELKITVGDVSETIEFPDVQKEQWVELSEPVNTSEISLMIVSVYEGNEWDDTCIAEVGVYGAETDR